MQNPSAEYDFANLTEKLSGLSGALLGRGASTGDLKITNENKTK
jgi:hypothetical protein